VSVVGVFQALLSDTPTSWSGRCCEPNSPHVEVILVVFGGDLFVNIVWEHHQYSKYIITSIGDFECSGVWLRLLKVGVIFGRMKASDIHLLYHGLVFHCTIDRMTTGGENAIIVIHSPP
jgi:hypothetical protein